MIDDGENYDNGLPPAFIPLFSVFYRQRGDMASDSLVKSGVEWGRYSIADSAGENRRSSSISAGAGHEIRVDGFAFL